MSTEPKILVVGNGFAGFWAAVAARRVAGLKADISVASPRPVLEIRPRLYEANPETLGVDLLPLFDKISVGYVRGEAVELDADARKVALSNGKHLSYDRLIVASGSRMTRPDVPGAELAFSVDTQAEAVAFDRRLAEIARDIAAPSIAVIGAGFAGIELTLELRDRLVAHGAASAAEDLRIVLIDRSQTLGHTLGLGPKAEIDAAMARSGVELRLGANVQAMTAESVSFDDDSALSVDAVVLASGMAASPFAAQVPGERDKLGRVVVDPALRAPSAPGVFVAGDAAVADTGDGHMTLQSCQHAGQLGRVAGENAVRDLIGLPTVPYEQLRYITCLDLGRSGAVITQGWERRVDKTGSEGKAVKRMVNTQVIYPPADESAESLLAYSSIDLAARTRGIDGPRAELEGIAQGGIAMAQEARTGDSAARCPPRRSRV